MENQCKIAIDYGSWFGGEKYEGFICLNLATKPENIALADDNIIRALKK